MRYVLDTSALLSGRIFEGELYIVPGVLRELGRHGITPQLRMFLDAKVRVASPGDDSAARIAVKAQETGDERRLSRVDSELLALALEIDATLVTDDYSMENIAKALGIPHSSVMMPPIKEEIHWKYRCTGCRKIWPEWHKECPVCGAALRTSRPRKG